MKRQSVHSEKEVWKSKLEEDKDDDDKLVFIKK